MSSSATRAGTAAGTGTSTSPDRATERVGPAELRRYERADDARATDVEVSPEVLGRPVRRKLFSHFLEHMSYATIGGLSAELAINPTFTRAHHLTPEQIAELRANAQAASAWADGASGPMRERWVSSPLASGVSVTVFDDETREGVPLGWSAVGGVGAVQPCGARIGDGVRLMARAGSVPAEESVTGVRVPLDGPLSGVRQAVYVPVHRTRTLLVHLVARATSGSGTVEVGVRRRTARGGALGAAGLVLARGAARVDHESWSSTDAVLEVEGDLAPNDPVDLYVRWHPDGPADDLVLDRISVLPSDHVDGLDPEVVAIAAEAGIAELRWPGGNAASYYHWRDGVGPADLRPTRPNYAWGGFETHVIGTDEYIAFCRRIGAEPHITVNSGTAPPEEAAAWVEYCNGDTSTPMGALRAANGHPEPYDVRIWEVGNENFGTWQGGFVGSEENARRFAEFARAMRAASPIPLTLHACGNWFDMVTPRRELDLVVADGTWHAELLRQAPDDVDVISLHALPANDVLLDGLTEAQAHESLMAQVVSTERALFPTLLAACDAVQRSPDRDPVRLSVTEWGPLGWHKSRLMVENFSGATWGVTFLEALARFGDRIEMASPNGFHHAGALKKGAGVVYTDPVFDIVGRMSRLTGSRPVAVTTRGPGYDVELATDLGRPEQDVPYVEAFGALSADGARLDVLLASRRYAGADDVRFNVPAGWEHAEVSTEVLTAPELTTRASPVEPRPADWAPVSIPTKNGVLDVDLPAYSVVWIALTRRSASTAEADVEASLEREQH